MQNGEENQNKENEQPKKKLKSKLKKEYTAKDMLALCLLFILVGIPLLSFILVLILFIQDALLIGICVVIPFGAIKAINRTNKEYKLKKLKLEHDKHKF